MKRKLTATPWAKQFRDDIEALRDFDESDDVVREMNGDLRRDFSLHVESFCALDVNVTRTRYRS